MKSATPVSRTFLPIKRRAITSPTSHSAEWQFPRGTDPAVKEKLEDVCAKAIEDPAFVEFMNNNGQTIAYLDAAGYTEFLKQSAEDETEIH